MTKDIENRKALRKKFAEAKDLSKEKLIRITKVFSEEEREKISERMNKEVIKRNELKEIRGVVFS